MIQQHQKNLKQIHRESRSMAMFGIAYLTYNPYLAASTHSNDQIIVKKKKKLFPQKY